MFEIIKVFNLNESLFVDENLIVIIGFIDLFKGGGNLRKLFIIFLFGFKNSIERKKLFFYV